jgi:predicted NBD/HSP70 family sugar kinase
MAMETIAGAAGPVARPAGATVAIAPDLGWPAELIELELRARLGFAVTVENAVTLAAFAELADPRGARLPACLYVTANAGVAARIIAGGVVRLDPRRGDALDRFGHICVDDGGPECGCGRRGCLDAYVQRAAVLRAAGLGDACLADLIAHARASDPRALVALAGCGRWLGIALAGVVNLIAPPAIVLGGEFALLAPWISPALEGELALRVLGHDREWPELVVSRLGDHAPVLGAAATVLQGDPATSRRFDERGNY